MGLLEFVSLILVIVISYMFSVVQRILLDYAMVEKTFESIISVLIWNVIFIIFVVFSIDKIVNVNDNDVEG